jgi:hypothetical protein
MRAVTLVGLVWLCACGDGGGGGTNHVEDPQPAAGGGVHGGAIAGELNVFVIDQITRQPIAAAEVAIDPGSGEAITGTTDVHGLLVVTDSRLAGATDVTVRASGHVPATWLGVNGAVVTVPLGDPTPDQLPTATATGTIAGWDDLPLPAAQHLTIAIVGFSLTDRLGDPANGVRQPPSEGLPPNACARLPAGAPSPPCEWSLVTRVGPQSHYAIIVDLDTQGTEDGSDDTLTPIGYALLTGLDLLESEVSTGEVLSILDDAPVELQVDFPPAPAGLSRLEALALVHLPGELLPMAVPAMTPTAPIGRAPALTGPLAGATYDLIVTAKAGAGVDDPNSTMLMRDVSASATIVVGDFLALPGGLSAEGGTYAFTPVDGADFHGVDFERPTGEEVWTVAIHDDRSSFTLPGLPDGALDMHVTALELPGLDPTDYDLDGLFDRVTRTAEGLLSFTR